MERLARSARAASPRRRILWILAPVLLFLAIISRTTELGVLVRVFAEATPLWLLLALLLQVAFTVNQGALYQAVFRLLDALVPLRTAVHLALVMAFASLASPAGTAAGVAYFVAAASERGLPISRAFWTSLTYYLFDYSAFLLVLVAGLLVLFFHHDLHASQLIAVGLLYAAVVAGAAVVFWGMLHPTRVRRLLVGPAEVVNRLGQRLFHHPLIGADQVARWTEELQEVLAIARQRPDRAGRPLFLALVSQGISLATLAAAFWALGYPIHPGVLVAGYAVGALFMIVSITPSGVGVVEGAMTVTFSSLFVPLEIAVAATLLFRLFTFWLPILAGFLALRFLPPAAEGSAS